MTIASGSLITADDLRGIWSVPLTTLATYNTLVNPYKQFTEVFQVRGVTNLTSEILRTVLYTPRTDVILRGFRVMCSSATVGIVATASIPAQVIRDNVIAGGNIPYSITATATSTAIAGDLSVTTGLATIPNNTIVSFLAGDNIDIVVSTNSATAANVTVTLLLENVLTG